MLLAGVVYLGILSGRDNKYVVWFGIASAIVAPTGLTLFGYALASGERDLIQRLAKVPEIEKLISDAKTQEEKIALLEAERKRLVDVVKIESRRQAIHDRIESLESDAVRIVRELKNLDDEALAIEERISESPVADEIQRLHERVRARQDGDVVLRIGRRVYRVDRDIVKALPFSIGNFVLAYFRASGRLSEWWRNRRGTG
jgi:Skp family chaperone for outer membrane proteins